MASVRDLTTRFKFETDRRGLNEFREGIIGAKTAIAGLAAALGVGVAAKAIFSAGESLRRAGILARQFTDEVVMLDGNVELVGELADAWKRVQDAIPGRETMIEFLDAFVKFRQSFRDAPLEQFETLFEAAGNLARITGKPLGEMFELLHRAVISGDFEALVELLPSLDAADAQMANFVRQLIEVDVTRVQTVEQRLRLISDILEEANPQLAETAELIMETTTGGQWDELMANFRRLGEILGLRIKPLLLDILQTSNDFMNVWIDGGVSVESFVVAFRAAFGVEMPGILQSLARVMARMFTDPGAFIRDVGEGVGTLGRIIGRKADDAFDFLFGTPEFRSIPGPQLPRGDPRRREATLGLGFQSGVGIFAPQITVNGAGDPESTAQQIIRIVGDFWDQAADQFTPQEEAP